MKYCDSFKENYNSIGIGFDAAYFTTFLKRMSFLFNPSWPDYYNMYQQDKEWIKD